jgi:Amt family ammonium transporter
MLPKVRLFDGSERAILTYHLVKYYLQIDDALDVFAEHAVGGMLGLFFNALFGADYIIGLDGVNTGIIPGGWVNRNWRQMYVQVAYIVAATFYSFVVSAILAFIINYIPGLHLRASEEAELLGMDDDQLGEFAYDYVEVRRDYLAWTPANKDQHADGEEIPIGQRHGITEHGDMLEGKTPTGSQDGDGTEHTGVAGDRHGVLAEEKKSRQD